MQRKLRRTVSCEEQDIAACHRPALWKVHVPVRPTIAADKAHGPGLTEP